MNQLKKLFDRKKEVISTDAVQAFQYEDWSKRYLRRSYEIESNMLGTKVDIVVPVYNAEKSLPRFLNDIQKTNLEFRLIIIDDASSDEHTRTLLQEYAHAHTNVDLVRNSQNIGVVGSINRGLAMARNHVVLLSANVQLPQNWLERLIAPIVKDPTVASATPFTNSGSICSFPVSYKSNNVFDHIDVEKIDRYFREIRSIYTTIPTGVNFCMALSKNAIKEVGLMDQKTFGKGFGEDTDWCRRAVQMGFRNVMVENLYVFHNTSYTMYADDRRRQVQINREKLMQQHPDLIEVMRKFSMLDPLGPIRSYVLCRLTSMLSSKRYMIFHSELEGGSNIYIQRYAEHRRNEKAVTVLIRYRRDVGIYQVEYQWGKYKAILDMLSLEEVFEFCDTMELNQVIVNHLVTYPNLREHLKKIREYTEEKGIRLMTMVHDYYLICPSMYLMNENEEYCEVRSLSRCEQCLKNQTGYSLQGFSSVREWRSAWRNFLMACQEVRVFSQDSATLVKKAYGGLDQVQILPTQHTVLPKIKKEYKTTETLNIGLLGTLTDFKGLKLVSQMVKMVNETKLPVRFVLCGSTSEKFKGKGLIQTGKYQTEKLPELIYKYDIDLFFISSIYPETFSFTTQEAMEMGMPVACLPLGAPAERVMRYENGLVLAQMDAPAVLQQLLEFGERIRKPIKSKDKALFLWEKKTEQSRYRIEHLQEQLYAVGISSECYALEEVNTVKIRRYKWIIVYNCTASKKVLRLINAANESGASIWYSIDDYIFDEKVLQKSLVSKSNGYREKVLKSTSILDCMKACDGILVPTEELKNVVSSIFKGKTILTQKDVASYEMIAISTRALSHRRVRYHSVILGFIGDQDTYDIEFTNIEPIILEIMDQYPQVKLRIGGAAKISKELEMMGERVKRWNERSWKEQPTLFTRIDIHLMPIAKDPYYEVKSDTKWIEASLLKIPTVMSDCKKTDSILKQGENVVFCGSKDEWKQKLIQLIENAELRERIGKVAQDTVLSMRTSAELEENVQQIFR